MLYTRITSFFTALLFLCTTSASDELSNLGRLFQWSALIITRFDNVTVNGSNSTHHCNGAYIGVKHVITAGMCVSGFKKFRIILGPHYAQYGVDIYKLEFIHDQIVITTGTDKRNSHDNKLTIINLGQDPRFPGGSYLQPVTLPPLPTPFQLNDALDTNFTAVEAGWIRNEDGVVEQQWVDITVLDFVGCLTVRPFVNIHKELCATGVKVEDNYHNLCPRIGNPLVTGASTLIGIGTVETCVDNGPQTYIRINGYREWIEDTLRSEL